jgi:hypothetical protein
MDRRLSSKVLRRTAERLGLRFLERDGVMIGRLGALRMSVWVKSGYASPQVLVVIHMPNLGLGLWIRPEHKLDKLWQAMGGRDVRFGDSRIDSALFIRADFREWVRRYVNTVALRAALDALLDRGARVCVSDHRVLIRSTLVNARALEEVALETLALAQALQVRSNTALDLLEVEGLHTSAAVGAGNVDGTPIAIREVERPTGSGFEIKARMPWSTAGLRVTHVDEGRSELGDLVLDMLVSAVAEDMGCLRAKLCQEGVRAPLASICHGRPGSVWMERTLVTYADNDIADLTSAVEDVVELANALRGPPIHEDDARSGTGHLGDAVLEGALGGAAQDDQVAPSHRKALTGSPADRADEEAPGLSDGHQGNQ